MQAGVVGPCLLRQTGDPGAEAVKASQLYEPGTDLFDQLGSLGVFLRLQQMVDCFLELPRLAKIAGCPMV